MGRPGRRDYYPSPVTVAAALVDPQGPSIVDRPVTSRGKAYPPGIKHGLLENPSFEGFFLSKAVVFGRTSVCHV